MNENYVGPKDKENGEEDDEEILGVVSTDTRGWPFGQFWDGGAGRKS